MLYLVLVIYNGSKVADHMEKYSVQVLSTGFLYWLLF
jgi:hypothetical protein